MRLYRLLLRLYPASFRHEYGEEMCRVFSDQRRNASGPFSVPAVWLEAVSDLLRSAIQVQWDLLRQDLRYTFRTLARAPAFALTAVVVTALGIGANTAVFAITDRVLVRPLPFEEPDRLVKLWENVPRYARLEPSPANYRDWRRMSSSFESMAAFHALSVNLLSYGDPLRLEGRAVTGELFPLLGVEPLLGRFITTEDEREDAENVVLLSYRLWQGVFGGDEGILGTSLRLDDTRYTVVGVMPREFYFPSRDTELWTSRRFAPEEFQDRDNNYLEVIATLAPDVSVQQARAEMELVTERLERDFPEENVETRATVISIRDELSQKARLLLMALFGASLCVLGIACANLAGLMLARGVERRKEMTVRTALGGGRERLVRQLMTESLVLAVIGGMAGLALASSALPLFARLVPVELPVSEPSVLDGRVLGFATLVTALSAVGFGVLPALRSAGGVDMKALREGSRAGRRRERVRSALVVAQVAASVILLIASGLLIRALWRVRSVDPGFRTQDVLAVHLPLPMSKYESVPVRETLYSQVLTEVRALPRVSNAAFVSFLPIVMGAGIWPVAIEGLPHSGQYSETASLRFVTPDFFSTMGIPIRSGRDVSESDTDDSPFVAVVSESFARRYWPDRNPLGRRFRFAFRERMVVGVVGDIRVRGLERASEPQVYLPSAQVPNGGLVFYAPKELVVRASGNLDQLVPELRRIIRAADPELPVAEVRTLQDVLHAETAPRTTQIRILGGFAALSLILSAVGIYGLLSFAVSQRRSEIGLRIALGAPYSGILAMVMRQGVVLALVGATAGALLGYAAGRAMESLLFGVVPADAPTYAVAAAIALVTTISGSLIPALRAVRVDPTRAIRAE